MRDKDQLLFYSEAEFALFKAVFADNEDLLYIVRKVMYQFPLSEEDKRRFRAQISPETIKLLRKAIKPEIDDSYTIGNVNELNNLLNDDFRTKSPEQMGHIFKAHKLILDYLDQQLETLSDLDKIPKLLLDKMKEINPKKLEDTWVGNRARNYILAWIDEKFKFIRSNAGIKGETPEELKARLIRNEKNSAK